MNDDDIVFEEDNESVAPKDAEKTIKKLKEKIKALETEKQEYLSGWQKARADFVNLRKKDEEEKKSFAKYAAEDILSDIIPVLDSFDMAFANKEAWEKVDQSWRIGVEYIYNQLRTVLEQRGFSDIHPAVGSKFDVRTSEAIKNIDTDDETRGETVAEVSKRGYSYNDRTVRPAQVAIFVYKKS